jgi:hypothetical protein
VPENSLTAAPWVRILGCAAWPLVVPVTLWFSAISGLRRNLWTPDARRLPAARAGLTERWITHFAVPIVLLCLALAFLSCWVVYLHVRSSRSPLAFRVMMDLVLLSAFALAPWLVSLVLLGRGWHSIVDAWLMPGFAYRAVPTFCGFLAAGSFFLLERTRKVRHGIEAA